MGGTGELGPSQYSPGFLGAAHHLRRAMKYEDEARDSKEKSVAFGKLQALVSMGAARQSEIISRVMTTVIVDKLVPPKVMHFDPKKRKGNSDFHLQYSAPDGGLIVRIHIHALRQMAKICGIPATYVSSLIDGVVDIPEEVRREHLCYCFNLHFRQGTFTDKRGNIAKYLHRIVGDELRGVLSRNYNRKLGTITTLRPFLERCYKHQAGPISAIASPTKVILSCVLPVIFEPVAGEFVAFGATYSNSDFGDGKMLISGTVLRIKSGTISVLEDKLSKVHLGAVISEEEISLSAATLQKEAAAYVSAIEDMVDAQFKEENIASYLKAIQIAHEKRLSWDQVRVLVAEILYKGEVDELEKLLMEGKVEDLPPVTRTDNGDPQANAWWTSAALGWLANKVEDDERRASIQALAGKVLK